MSTNILPSEAAARKAIPIASGVLDYFPAALAEVAKVSKAGNDQHNPGQPLHWARGKSMDQDDTIMRHFLERGGADSDGFRHSAKLAWRVLALLQIELEAAGAPLARGARLPEEPIVCTPCPGNDMWNPQPVPPPPPAPPPWKGTVEGRFEDYRGPHGELLSIPRADPKIAWPSPAREVGG